MATNNNTTANAPKYNNANAQGCFFSLTGYVAVDATIRSFETSAVARWPLSIAVTKEDKEGKNVRKSALVPMEMWAKSADSQRFALLKKGTRVTVSGVIVPDCYTDSNGVSHERIVFVVKSIGKTPVKKAEPQATVAEAV